MSLIATLRKKIAYELITGFSHPVNLTEVQIRMTLGWTFTKKLQKFVTRKKKKEERKKRRKNWAGYFSKHFILRG